MTYTSLKDPFTNPRSEDRKEEFRLLYGNVTALSDRIKSALFSKACRDSFPAHCLVETKIKSTEVSSLSNILEQHNLHSAINPGEGSASGDGVHGGELVAVSSNLTFRSVDKTI